MGFIIAFESTIRTLEIIVYVRGVYGILKTEQRNFATQLYVT